MEIYHSEIINLLIEKYGLKSYLEIGLDKGDNFRQIQCALKESIDPYLDYGSSSNGDQVFYENGELPDEIKEILTYRMTSDEFFVTHENKYDLIFIDGLHTEEQVGKDIINGLKHLNPGGFIVVHDCLPPREECQIVPRVCCEWNGDVWKAISVLRTQNINFDVVDSDYGCAVIPYCENPERLHYLEKSWYEYNQVFTSDYVKKGILHVISTLEFIKKYI